MKNKVQAVEIRFLRNVTGITRSNRVIYKAETVGVGSNNTGKKRERKHEIP